MSEKEKEEEVIHTKIWNEIPEEDNPFAAKECYLAGYNVYEDLLGKVSWAEYLYLLFKLEKPTKKQARLLETIAIAIANPGIRDHSVRAAMNAGVGGSTAASTLISALAVGAGQYGGAREVYLLLQIWKIASTDLSAWKEIIHNPPKPQLPDSWPEIKHSLGFDPNSQSCSTPVLKTLSTLVSYHNSGSLLWLKENRKNLEKISGCSLSMTGVIAAAFNDLEFDPEHAEMLYLFLRLPGAAAHALEQKHYGWSKYPFFGNGLKILDDPGPNEE